MLYHDDSSYGGLNILLTIYIYIYWGSDMDRLEWFVDGPYINAEEPHPIKDLAFQ
jgi:hypothetical protein